MIKVTCKKAFTLVKQNISAQPGDVIEVPEDAVGGLVAMDLINPPTIVEDNEEIEDGTDS